MRIMAVVAAAAGVVAGGGGCIAVVVVVVVAVVVGGGGRIAAVAAAAAPIQSNRHVLLPSPLAPEEETYASLTKVAAAAAADAAPFPRGFDGAEVLHCLLDDDFPQFYSKEKKIDTKKKKDNDRN